MAVVEADVDVEDGIAILFYLFIYLFFFFFFWTQWLASIMHILYHVTPDTA